MKARSSYNILSITAVVAVLVVLNSVKSTEARPFLPLSVSSVRGGSTTQAQLDRLDDGDDGAAEEDPEVLKRMEMLRKYRMDQQMLMQLRSTFLSEALASRGLSMTTLVDVSTADGEKQPAKVDWDCAMSTEEEPKTCLYSFDAEPNTKVIAPLGTTQWISLSALNRLRRTDPSKVEPMWHSQYAVMKSWFRDDSEYSVIQHSGPKGLALSLLLDQTIVLKGLITTAVLLFGIIFLPLIDFFINRTMVSSTIWMNWPQWARIVHAALPLKLLLGQMAWKFMANMFGKVEQRVKDMLVELECATLEETVPLTVGPGSELLEVDDELDLGTSFQSGCEGESDDSDGTLSDVDNDED